MNGLSGRQRIPNSSSDGTERALTERFQIIVMMMVYAGCFYGMNILI